jgi:hypothetical protein
MKNRKKTANNIRMVAVATAAVWLVSALAFLVFAETATGDRAVLYLLFSFVMAAGGLWRFHRDLSDADEIEGRKKED